MHPLISRGQSLWQQAPAFYFGLLITLSFLAGLGFLSLLLPLALLLLIGIKRRASACFALLIFLFGALSPLIQKEQGDFTVKILSVKKGARRGFVYRAQILSPFRSHLPCYLYSNEWRDPDQLWKISGKVKLGKGFFYLLTSKSPWENAGISHTLAKQRYLAKEAVTAYFAKVIEPKEARALLSAFANDNMEDPCLMKLFSQCGLVHVIAVSGFNFTLLALFFFFIFRLFLPEKITYLLTLCLLTLYFLFLGNNPSVLRAWIASLVLFGGKILKRRASGLNSLGAALLIAFLLDPFSSTSLSFQLSFLATGAIFLIFPTLDEAAKKLFPSKKTVVTLIRQAITLDLAVHLALFPVLLFTFHQLPLQSLFYNLLFPTLFSLSFFLMPLAAFFHLLIPPLGLLLHQINAIYTQGLLDILSNHIFPHKTIYMDTLTGLFATLVVTLLFCLSLMHKKREGIFDVNETSKS